MPKVVKNIYIISISGPFEFNNDVFLLKKQLIRGYIMSSFGRC